MTRPISLAALVLALSAPAVAEEPLPAPPPAHEEPTLGERAPLDITGRLRASGDGLTLELGGARLEVRLSGDRLALEAPGSREPGAHDLRASFSLDGRTTSLLLRFVPPRGGEPGVAPR